MELNIFLLFGCHELINKQILQFEIRKVQKGSFSRISQNIFQCLNFHYMIDCLEISEEYDYLYCWHYNNELQEIAMNLAIFLHSQKQFKDSTLALPLAPLYSLPHHKWYFSSAGLTPLRKRRQNTSLFKYLQELQILSEKAQRNSNSNFTEDDRQILCIHEKYSYFDNKMKHLFDTIYQQSRLYPSDSEKIHCECTQLIEEESPKHFFTNAETLNKCLFLSKKQPKNEAITNQEEKINWYEFSKNLISSQLGKQTYSLNEESLSLYKLPQSKGNSPCIFNVLWNDNYLIFNNGNKLEVNQNMKAKAVELCQSIYRKLEAHIWAKMQSYIPKIAEDVKDHQSFISRLEKKSKISTFRVWFYKKETNNQIYILSLSHITFKGADCIIYKDFNIKSESLPQELIKQEENPKERVSYLTELNKSYEHKPKAFSVSNKSHKALRGIVNLTQMQRLKNLLDGTSLDIIPFKPKEIFIKQQQTTDIQCSCCRNLITTAQVVNEVTANHIEEIRYLRQIKIGKIEASPYDFVKICTLCYNTYLQFYKRKSVEKKSDKQTIYRSQTSKNSHSFLERPIMQDTKWKAPSQSSKRLLFAKESKERARSQLNNSKDRQSVRDERLMAKDRSISLKPPLYCPTKKKIRTTNTTVTENTLFHRQEFPELNTSKNHTQQQYASVSNHNSIKIKTQLPSKTHNLINKIISSSFQAKHSSKPQQPLPPSSSAIKTANTNIIMNAIDQYEKIQRLSFKKLITKNHRSYLIKETSQHTLPWKKSTKACFQN